MRSNRQLAIVALLVTVGVALLWATYGDSRCAPIEAGFWFEPIAFAEDTLGGRLSSQDFAAVEAVARKEVRTALGDFNISISDNQDARVQVRVVQELRDMRFRRQVLIPAESRAVAGLGGKGAVNFSWFAHSAIAYANGQMTPPAVIDAIGRGIGRAAIHEFAHILFPSAPIHDSKDIRAFEYFSAARLEQFFGEMHWDVARPLLESRVAQCRQ